MSQSLSLPRRDMLQSAAGRIFRGPGHVDPNNALALVSTQHTQHERVGVFLFSDTRRNERVPSCRIESRPLPLGPPCIVSACGQLSGVMDGAPLPGEPHTPNNAADNSSHFTRVIDDRGDGTLNNGLIL